MTMVDIEPIIHTLNEYNKYMVEAQESFVSQYKSENPLYNQMKERIDFALAILNMAKESVYEVY